MKAYPIDFVRQALEQTLLEQHIESPKKYVGGSSQISIKSFYEQVQTQEQVDRFVETFRDLEEQANRAGLIGNGVISLDENPTITNINRGLVVPMTWKCVIRCTLEDRDIMTDSINNLFKILKGKKVDMAEFSNGEVFKVGTIGVHGGETTPYIEPCDFIGAINPELDINSQVNTLIAAYYSNYGFTIKDKVNTPRYFYATDSTQSALYTIVKHGDYYQLQNEAEANVILSPQSMAFEKYKLSLSFDSIRVDEPKTLNGKEYMYISFSGSATLTNETTRLGNDLQCVAFKKYKVLSSTDISYSSATFEYLEPLELPNTGSLNTKINHIVDNGFIPNSHADTLSPTLQYTFLLDTSIPLLKQLFLYSRYGINSPTNDYITPNLIFLIDEIWSSWGVIEKYEYYGKITGDVNVENTESDVLTVQISVDIQGSLGV